MNELILSIKSVFRKEKNSDSVKSCTCTISKENSLKLKTMFNNLVLPVQYYIYGDISYMEITFCVIWNETSLNYVSEECSCLSLLILNEFMKQSPNSCSDITSCLHMYNINRFYACSKMIHDVYVMTVMNKSRERI